MHSWPSKRQCFGSARTLLDSAWSGIYLLGEPFSVSVMHKVRIGTVRRLSCTNIRSDLAQTIHGLAKCSPMSYFLHICGTCKLIE